MTTARSTVAPAPPGTAGTSKQARLLTVDAAREAILAGVPGPDRAAAERLPLGGALGRVLADDITAVLSMPRWPNSAMDGYAVRRADIEAGADGGMHVSQRVAAGVAPEPLRPGTAARIFTGAPVPAGADTVIMQEHCREAGGRVHVDLLPEIGANIRAAGEDFRAGDPVLRAGELLRPQHIALAASSGAAMVAVHRRPTVALLVTGDELVSPGEALGPGQIHESNGHLLAALVAQLGAEVALMETVPDDADATRSALARAADTADLVLTSGGVSVGDADHVRGAIEAVGELAFFGIAVKPGKPLAFGRVADKPLLGLPGNPVSLFVTFALFGAPLLRHLQGRAITMAAPLQLPAGFEQTRTRARADYLRVRLDHGRVHPHGEQGSGILSSTAGADGLACVPPNTPVAPGDPLPYYPMDALLN